jgi:3-dehydroquinate synthase
MKTRRVEVRTKRDESKYSISVGESLLPESGRSLRKVVGREARNAFVISNPTVFKLYGDSVTDSLRSAGFDVSAFLMKDGEQYKTLTTVDAALVAMRDAGLSRTDVVVGLGGGVVGDLSGFAAAVHLRGVRFFLIPTTLLSMVDASVGGKTGVNSAAGKNVIGAFHQPDGVLIDIETLGTLHRRDVTAGLCEMVKHGLLAGNGLWKDTLKILKGGEIEIGKDLAELIAANAEFKAKIVSGDERESSERTDSRSRKLLNLGHTLAHALEMVTDYKHLRHGEAVGHGLKFIAELSNSLALLDKESVKLINDVVHRTGLAPVPAGIDPEKVLAAFRSDKKQIGGSLQMILLKGIGKPVIRRMDEIPLTSVKKALRAALR